MGMMGLESLGHQPALEPGGKVGGDGVLKRSLLGSEACEMQLQGALVIYHARFLLLPWAECPKVDCFASCGSCPDLAFLLFFSCCLRGLVRQTACKGW